MNLAGLPASTRIEASICTPSTVATTVARCVASIPSRTVTLARPAESLVATRGNTEALVAEKRTSRPGMGDPCSSRSASTNGLGRTMATVPTRSAPETNPVCSVDNAPGPSDTGTNASSSSPTLTCSQPLSRRSPPATVNTASPRSSVVLSESAMSMSAELALSWTC